MDALDQLLEIVQNGVADIKRAYAAASRDLPNLNELYDGPHEVEKTVAPTTALVVAAAQQLVATLQPPGQYLYDIAYGTSKTAALGVVMKTNVPEILREGGPKGLAVKDIAKTAGTSSERLGQFLRILATRHVLREVTPGVFAHNRVSSVLDTGKSLEEILANPIAKHNGTNGLPAFIEAISLDPPRAMALLPDLMAEPEWCKSDDPKDAPVPRAFGVDGTFYEWISAPGNEARRARFGVGMMGYAQLSSPDVITSGFPWQTLPAGSVIVDVGGGVGSAVRALFAGFPQLRFVVEDLPPTIANARGYWDQECPEAIVGGQVQLRAHDFFEPQPVKDAAVFLLRAIIHNWPTEYARKILRQLAHAAMPTTRVVLVDLVLPYATQASASPLTADIPGAGHPQLPSPLLMSAGEERSYDLDISMLNTFMAQERTLGDYLHLLEGTGWKLAEVISPTAGAPSHVVLELSEQ